MMTDLAGARDGELTTTKSREDLAYILLRQLCLSEFGECLDDGPTGSGRVVEHFVRVGQKVIEPLNLPLILGHAPQPGKE